MPMVTGSRASVTFTVPGVCEEKRGLLMDSDIVCGHLTDTRVNPSPSPRHVSVPGP